MNKDHAIGFGIGLLAGAVLGGTIALLLAPASGKDTRHFIADEASKVGGAVRDETNSVINSVRGAESEAMRRGQNAVNALRG